MTTTSNNAIIEEFRRMDADGDGVVDLTDFLRAPRKLLATLGVPEDAPKAQALIRANETQWGFFLSLGDADGDGVLTADEYVTTRTSPEFRSPNRPGKGEVCQTLFAVLDSDDDGTISEDEFLHAAGFLCMPPTEASAYFATLDSDNDGQLSSKEFLKAVKRFYTS
ncbi:EF-hand domain-containing protein [Streptomyces sp. ISL-98]|uniref:EF-hand domain-containing protein n=1 Tax=Streptomyces sp. ISL-98 TaxID=2819192 RepID=UPI001BE89416|nr:EF-hand domain-containing protein [Streptomyces sp. ISL-98]MBT2510047.1 EF-hand domain-containing protein [Streptomyces sp. ISL-98]